MASLPPPPYSAKSSASSGASVSTHSGALVNISHTTYEAHFDRFNTLKRISLDDEYEAVPIWQIQRKKPATRAEIAQANLLNNWWIPKNSEASQAQRCPFVSVDNFCILYTPEMYALNQEPHVILGIWDKKNIVLYGRQQNVRGLVLAGGGHFERMADKNTRPDKAAQYGIQRFENGDMSLKDAADKELNEEIGINKANVCITRELGFMDDALSEPRAHYLRCIYLRWIKQSPKASDELKTVIAVPITHLKALCARTKVWRDKDNNELNLELNHDRLIQLILKHPSTEAFLTNILTACENENECSSSVTCSGSSKSSSMVFQ